MGTQLHIYDLDDDFDLDLDDDFDLDLDDVLDDDLDDDLDLYTKKLYQISRPIINNNLIQSPVFDIINDVSNIDNNKPTINLKKKKIEKTSLKKQILFTVDIKMSDTHYNKDALEFFVSNISKSLDHTMGDKIKESKIHGYSDKIHISWNNITE